MIYLTNLMKWHTLRSQMNVIIRAALTIGLGGAEAPGPEQGGGP